MRAQGRVSLEDYRLIRAGLSHDTYVRALRYKVQAAAGDLIDDMQRWLKIAVEWMVKNWDTVLKVALSLLLMLL
jgi:hypothetical protein